MFAWLASLVFHAVAAPCAADTAFEPNSTLAPQVAPDNPCLQWLAADSLPSVRAEQHSGDTARPNPFTASGAAKSETGNTAVFTAPTSEGGVIYYSADARFARRWRARQRQSTPEEDQRSTHRVEIDPSITLPTSSGDTTDDATAEPEPADTGEGETSTDPAATGWPMPAADPRAAAGEPLDGMNQPISKQQQALLAKVRRVLAHYYKRPLNTRDRSPWEVMHAILAFENNSHIRELGPRGEPTSAVGWMCFNQVCKRWKLMYINNDSELRVRVGPALQGHHGQLLAMLAQARVPADYPMQIEGRDFTVADLIEMEKQTCYPRTELTFKLIALMHYLDSDARWMNDQGMEWDIPRLIREEIRQPIRGAACGGTHRLTGLTLAYKTRLHRDEPVDGDYLRAQKFVAQYQRYALRLQNPDGSFSTEWFRGPGDEADIDRRLKTTGHILEWMLYASDANQLRSRRTTRAVNYLANLMYNNRYRDWEAGPLGHAVHAMLLYDRLMSPAAAESQSLARQPQSTESATRGNRR